VVGNNQISARLERLSNTLRDHIHDETDMRNRVAPVPHHNPDGIPLFGTGGWPESLYLIGYKRQRQG
jgi:hypothetical protein